MKQHQHVFIIYPYPICSMYGISHSQHLPEQNHPHVDIIYCIYKYIYIYILWVFHGKFSIQTEGNSVGSVSRIFRFQRHRGNEFHEYRLLLNLGSVSRCKSCRFSCRFQRYREVPATWAHQGSGNLPDPFWLQICIILHNVHM